MDFDGQQNESGYHQSKLITEVDKKRYYIEEWILIEKDKEVDRI